MGAPMTVYPRYAVSCAGPVHPPVKDHAGLVPNTLKWHFVFCLDDPENLENYDVYFYSSILLLILPFFLAFILSSFMHWIVFHYKEFKILGDYISLC